MSEYTYGKTNIVVPDGWALDYHSINVNYNEYKDDLDQPIFKRKGTFAAKQTHYESVHNIELRSNYNGSGQSAFGGASSWPAITAKVAFNEGEYQLAVDFAQSLGEFIDTWMKQHNR
jgi:hypothetical protein